MEQTEFPYQPHLFSADLPEIPQDQPMFSTEAIYWAPASITLEPGTISWPETQATMSQNSSELFDQSTFPEAPALDFEDELVNIFEGITHDELPYASIEPATNRVSRPLSWREKRRKHEYLKTTAQYRLYSEQNHEAKSRTTLRIIGKSALSHIKSIFERKAVRTTNSTNW